MTESAEDLMALALEDLESARHLFNARPRLLRTSAFHSQQTIEKALKAVLHSRGIRYPHTHDVVELAELVSPHIPELILMRAEFDQLREFAVEIRYSAIPVERQEAAQALRLAEWTYDFAQRQV